MTPMLAIVARQQIFTERETMNTGRKLGLDYKCRLTIEGQGIESDLPSHSKNGLHLGFWVQAPDSTVRPDFLRLRRIS